MPNIRFNADITDKPQMQVKRMLGGRLIEPPGLGIEVENKFKIERLDIERIEIESLEESQQELLRNERLNPMNFARFSNIRQEKLL